MWSPKWAEWKGTAMVLGAPVLQTICKPTGRDRMGLEGTERDEGSPKSVQEGTKRHQKGPNGTKNTELQYRGLQVRFLPGL